MSVPTETNSDVSSSSNKENVIVQNAVVKDTEVRDASLLKHFVKNYNPRSGFLWYKPKTWNLADIMNLFADITLAYYHTDKRLRENVLSLAADAYKKKKENTPISFDKLVARAYNIPITPEKRMSTSSVPAIDPAQVLLWIANFEGYIHIDRGEQPPVTTAQKDEILASVLRFLPYAREEKFEYLDVQQRVISLVQRYFSAPEIITFSSPGACSFSTAAEKEFSASYTIPLGERFALSVTAATDVGCKRPDNEDSFSVQNGTIVIADGIGGHACGEVASSLACSTISSEITASVDHIKKRDLGEKIDLVSILADAHQRILEDGRTDWGKQGMGTTVVAAHFSETDMQYAHAGDSRLYVFNPNKPAGLIPGTSLEQLTEDHKGGWHANNVWEAYQKGNKQPKEEIENSPTKGGRLLRCLGGDGINVDETKVTQVNRALTPGEVYLFCTDGLMELSDREIESILFTSYSAAPYDDALAAQALIKAAKEKGGKDNITVILSRVASQKNQALVPAVVVEPADTHYDSLYTLVANHYFREKKDADCLKALADCVKARTPFDHAVSDFTRKWYFHVAPAPEILDALATIKEAKKPALENILYSIASLDVRRRSPEIPSAMEAGAVFAYELGYNNVVYPDTAKRQIVDVLKYMQQASQLKMRKEDAIEQTLFMVDYFPPVYHQIEELLTDDNPINVKTARLMLTGISERQNNLEQRASGSIIAIALYIQFLDTQLSKQEKIIKARDEERKEREREERRLEMIAESNRLLKEQKERETAALRELERKYTAATQVLHKTTINELLHLPADQIRQILADLQLGENALQQPTHSQQKRALDLKVMGTKQQLVSGKDMTPALLSTLNPLPLYELAIQYNAPRFLLDQTETGDTLDLEHIEEVLLPYIRTQPKVSILVPETHRNVIAALWSVLDMQNKEQIEFCLVADGRNYEAREQLERIQGTLKSPSTLSPSLAHLRVRYRAAAQEQYCDPAFELARANLVLVAPEITPSSLEFIDRNISKALGYFTERHDKKYLVAKNKREERDNFLIVRSSAYIHGSSSYTDLKTRIETKYKQISKK